MALNPFESGEERTWLAIWYVLPKISLRQVHFPRLYPVSYASYKLSFGFRSEFPFIPVFKPSSTQFPLVGPLCRVFADQMILVLYTYFHQTERTGFTRPCAHSFGMTRKFMILSFPSPPHISKKVPLDFDIPICPPPKTKIETYFQKTLG